MVAQNNTLFITDTKSESSRQARLIVEQDLQALVADFDELEFVFDDQAVIYWRGKVLTEFSRIIMYGGVHRNLRIAHPLSVFLRHNNMRAFTAGAEHYWGVDKLSQMMHFCLAGLPIPHTYFASSELLVDNAGDRIGFPMVIKHILTSGGKQNFLVSSQFDLEKLASELGEGLYLAQEHIQNKGDFRVLLNEKGSHLVYLKQAQEGSHLNNVAAGARVSKIGSTPELLTLAEAARDIMKFPIAGIDLLQKEGRYLILEANMQPAVFGDPLASDKRELFQDSSNIE